MRREPTVRTLLAVLIALALLPGAPLRAQETAQDSLRTEVRQLSELVDSLRREVERLRAAGQGAEADDALVRLRAAAAAAAGGEQAAEPEPQEFVGRQRSLQALNPEISLTGDVFASLDPDDTDRDNYYPREFELSIVSNLDPFSRAKVFVSRHEEGGELAPFGHADEEAGGEDAHGGGFAVEEGYVEWVGLPGGLGLKLGRFYQQFGQLNRWHSHALPFQGRSLPHLAFIGEEPLAQTGASVRWLAPFGGGAGTYEATVDLTTSSNESLFGESGRPSVLANLNGFWQLSEATDLDLALSWVTGSHEDSVARVDRDLYGAEMSFTWRPPAASRYRGFNLRAGAMLLDGLVLEEEPAVGEEATHALGFWSMAELRLDQSWLVGGRFDWTENPAHPDETAWLAGPTLTWWQSEYVRIRAEYDLLGQADLDNRGRFYLQVTFAMGPHKHETY